MEDEPIALPDLSGVCPGCEGHFVLFYATHHRCPHIYKNGRQCPKWVSNQYTWCFRHFIEHSDKPDILYRVMNRQNSRNGG